MNLMSFDTTNIKPFYLTRKLFLIYLRKLILKSFVSFSCGCETYVVSLCRGRAIAFFNGPEETSTLEE